GVPFSRRQPPCPARHSGCSPDWTRTPYISFFILFYLCFLLTLCMALSGLPMPVACLVPGWLGLPALVVSMFCWPVVIEPLPLALTPVAEAPGALFGSVVSIFLISPAVGRCTLPLPADEAF